VDNYLEDLSIRRPCSLLHSRGDIAILLALINREILFWYPIKIMAVNRGWGGQITTGGGGDGRTVGAPFSPLSGEGCFV